MSSTSGSTRCSTTTRRSGFAREGEDLTDDVLAGERSPDRQGHPQVPRRLLAGAADGGRARAAASTMFVHGFLLMDGEKMSKSLGNVLDPFDVIERFGTDALRYYCFREVSFGQDGSVSTTGFEARYESELANDYGNLAQPHARDDRALSRRRRARRSRPTRAGGRVRRSLRDGRDAAGQSRAEPGARSRSGSACGGSTGTSRSARRGSSRRIPRAADALDETLASLVEGAARRDRAAAPVHAARDATSCSTRSDRP